MLWPLRSLATPVTESLQKAWAAPPVAGPGHRTVLVIIKTKSPLAVYSLQWLKTECRWGGTETSVSTPSRGILAFRTEAHSKEEDEYVYSLLMMIDLISF